jgi:deoxyribodipyrimidine photo-lyase
MTGSETAVMWFRTDLRLHDSAALEAAAEASELLPMFVFDERAFGERAFGGVESFRFEKTGPHRTRFLRESVADLRASLRARGTDLVVRHGRPEVEVAAIAEAVDASSVCYQSLPTSEERALEAALTERLAGTSASPNAFWTHTLHHLADLPTPPHGMPDTFTPWRQTVEAESEVHEPRPVPCLPDLPAVDPGTIPSQADLGVAEPPEDERAVLPFEGGETRGRERVQTYLWERDKLRTYKETRNGLLGADYSSKLSPWLSLGCLSPRWVHAEAERYERERVANDSTYWLVFELRWRDFFQFQFVKHGARFFQPGGIRENDREWRDGARADELFGRWCDGETGVPFVDANMRELNRTGYVSNRGRQNVASFLANDCRVDWRRGAAYFETQLVDYDVASNYGNWAYNAQVGNDSRDSSFDVLAQAKRYDADAEYVTTWCPELEPLPAEYAHEPWRMTADEQAAFGVELGVDYPEPMLDVEAMSGRSR